MAGRQHHQHPTEQIITRLAPPTNTIDLYPLLHHFSSINLPQLPLPPPPSTTTPKPNTLAGARTDMSRPVCRVSSDLSHSNYSTATTGLHHKSTSNNDIMNGAKAKQRLSLLFSGVGAWRRSQGGGTTGRADQISGSSKKRQVNGSSKQGGLDIGDVVKKYMSIVEQFLITSFSGGRERERWRRPHSFTSGGGWNAPSKRHTGRLSSVPSSLRGSPANSGHLSVGGSVTKVSMSSEESTMEEFQSAIQAAIAHCKNSIAVAEQADGDRFKC